MNVLPATIKSIISSQELSCVNVQIGTDEFHLFLVEILDEKRFLNKNVKITFKETELILLQAKGFKLQDVIAKLEARKK